MGIRWSECRFVGSTHRLIARNPPPDTRRLCPRQEPPSRYVQICQPAADLEPVGILRQSPIADFGPSEDPLDHQERMFHFGTDLRLRPVPCPIGLTQRPVAMGFRLDETLGLWRVHHLRIIGVFGTLENAVKTRILIAVSVYVLVASLRSS